MEKNRTDIIAKLAANMVPIPGKQYSICKYLVTQELWESVMGENPSNFKGPDRPVENVSWNDCQAFIGKINEFPETKEVGLVFRLPSVDEWEVACRAGATGSCFRLADGTEITSETVRKVAWSLPNCNGATHPVGKKKPNAFGLYDMLGNVWEWTSTSAGYEKDKPQVHTAELTRFVCGASLNATKAYAECRNRDLIGLRLVCTTQEEREAATRREVAKRAAELAKLSSDLVPIPGRSCSICRFPVTQALWEAVMGDNPSYFRGDDRPVENVSRTDVEQFLEKINAMQEVKDSGRIYRLPTSGEWEYACRAGARGKYCMLADGMVVSGKTLGDVAWFRNNSNGKTHPVGQKKPNAFGLYDMLGNVREWAECAKEDQKGTWLDFGGSWCDYASNCIAVGGSEQSEWYYIFSSHFVRQFSGGVHSFQGFRLACDRLLTEIELRAASKVEKVAAAKREAAKRAAKEEVQKLAANMVEIPGKNFSICRYEVTQDLWEAVMGDNPSYFKGGDRPVERVSWIDCQKFLDSLNELPEVREAGFTYRFPTADEWEYACRAGATGDYCRLADGTEITWRTLGEVAWDIGNSAINFRRQTHPIGRKTPNAFGLYDMLGNVWEWLSTESVESEGRIVVCGGSYIDYPGYRVGSRCHTYSPDWRDCRLGLRLAR
jgi:formylglycine-generating enzyme required for sulfatase activity